MLITHYTDLHLVICSNLDFLNTMYLLNVHFITSRSYSNLNSFHPTVIIDMPYF